MQRLGHIATGLVLKAKAADLGCLPTLTYSPLPELGRVTALRTRVRRDLAQPYGAPEILFYGIFSSCHDHLWVWVISAIEFWWVWAKTPYLHLMNNLRPTKKFSRMGALLRWGRSGGSDFRFERIVTRSGRRIGFSRYWEDVREKTLEELRKDKRVEKSKAV